MGMVRKEVLDTPAQVTPPSPALPSFSQENTTAVINQPRPAAESQSKRSYTLPSKEEGMMRGGVAHDAATITAAMSAMKTDEEVKVLFTSLYEHILSLVSW